MVEGELSTTGTDTGLINVGPLPTPPEALLLGNAVMEDTTSPAWLTSLPERLAPAVRTLAATREAGLSLLLLGVAEAQGRRLPGLIGVVQALEAKVFAPARLGGLTTGQLISLYELAVSMMNQSTQVIAAVRQGVDFEKITTVIEGLLRGAGVPLPSPPLPAPPTAKPGAGRPPGPAQALALTQTLAAQILHVLYTKEKAKH
jgi:hypothetical protein